MFMFLEFFLFWFSSKMNRKVNRIILKSAIFYSRAPCYAEKSWDTKNRKTPYLFWFNDYHRLKKKQLNKIWVLPNLDSWTSFSVSNAVLMLFVFYPTKWWSALVFFPLQSTLRIVCFVKFPMPGNFQYLIVDIVSLNGEIGKKWHICGRFAKSNLLENFQTKTVKTQHCHFMIMCQLF